MLLGGGIVESINKKHISVCILTYRRSELLFKAIKSALSQVTNELFTFSLIVIDNDVDMTAKSIVDEIKIKSDIVIDYYVEPVKNIALARNLALSKAKGDYIAFLDDDEFADCFWLLELLKMLNVADVDVVNGPVEPVYAREPSRLVKASKFFNLNYGNGCTYYSVKATNNCLFKRSILAGNLIRFDEQYGLTGGEDTFFFKELEDNGCSFAWAAKAIVYEYIPKSRSSLVWVLKRSFRCGNVYRTYLNSDLCILKRIFNLLIIFSKIIYLVCMSVLNLLTVLIDRIWFARNLIDIFYNVGEVMAILNYKHYEYDR